MLQRYNFSFLHPKKKAHYYHKSAGHLCKFLQVPVHVGGHPGSPLLFVLDELLLQGVEGFVLLVHGHELVVRSFALQVLAVGVVDAAGVMQEARQAVQAPPLERACHGIVEDIGAIPVLDELAEAALHQLVAQDGVGQQRVLRRGETRHVLRRQAVVRGPAVGVGKDGEKGVHAHGGGTAQVGVGYFNHKLSHIYK